MQPGEGRAPPSPRYHMVSNFMLVSLVKISLFTQARRFEMAKQVYMKPGSRTINLRKIS